MSIMVQLAFRHLRADVIVGSHLISHRSLLRVEGWIYTCRQKKAAVGNKSKGKHVVSQLQAKGIE